MYYKHKYEKYKQKYLQLKNQQMGGMDNYINELKKLYPECVHDKGTITKAKEYEEKKYARSAGHFIGNLRLAQDCTSTYGGAIKLIKNDKVIKTIKPNWAANIIGTHTFNFNSKYVVLDGKRSYQHKIEI